VAGRVRWCEENAAREEDRRAEAEMIALGFSQADASDELKRRERLRAYGGRQ
jgi:hypothetical protein